jgi:hypothetical protein
MAIYLFKLVRRKIRENEAKKAIPTTDDSHLAPEVAPNHPQHQEQQHNSHGHGYSQLAASRDDHVNPDEIARQKEEARKRSNRQWKLMIGLALPNFLAAIDVTIVAPAIPLISSHFSMSLNPNPTIHHSDLTQLRPPFRKL